MVVLVVVLREENFATKPCSLDKTFVRHRIPTPHGKSWNFSEISRTWKVWEMSVPGKVLGIKVPEP